MGFIKKLFQKPKYVLSEKDLRWNRFIDEICCFKDSNGLNETQKNAELVFRYHAEMCNGGHSCYFECCSDRNPQELTQALITLGFPELAENFQQAILHGNEDDYIKSDNVFGNLENTLITLLREYVELHRDEIFR